MSVRMWAATRQPDDHPGEGVGDEADVGHPGLRRHIGEVRHPQPVGLGGSEVPLYEVGWPAGVGIGPGGEDPLAAAADATNPQLTHETAHLVPADVVAGALGRLPELVGPVDLAVGAPEHEQDVLQEGVSERPSRGLALLGRVVGARGHLQRPADGLDPVLASVFVDERHHHRGGRSSSAWAKYADALRKISLARRSSLTSCSSSLIRAGHPRCSSRP